MKSVYLCGFMGCGKSFTGRRLAKAMGVGFTDLDDYIVKKEEKSIPDIFKENGEGYFRELEAKCVKELSGGGVIACGGGTALNDDTARYMRENGTLMFLDVDFDTCYNRIKDDPNRPVAQGKTREELKELFAYRREIYLKNCSASVVAEDAGTVVKDIIQVVKNL